MEVRDLQCPAAYYGMIDLHILMQISYLLELLFFGPTYGNGKVSFAG